jgi:hypothetical protein
MMTVVHAIQWPLACLCGYLAGAVARRHKFPWWAAYGAALVPGLLIAAASTVFGPEHFGSNEQPWQGFVIWAPWAGLGLFAGIRGLGRAGLNALGFGGRGPR